MSSILFLTQVLPYPLDAGPKVRAYYVLRYLSQRHRVTLVSFVREEDRPEYIEHLKGLCEDVYTTPMHRSIGRSIWAAATSLVNSEPIVILRDRSSDMRAVIRTALEGRHFDFVHADQTSMLQYALFADSIVQGQHQLVLDAHNALFKVFGRLAKQTTNPVYRRVLDREEHRLRTYEQESYRRFDNVVFVTDEDRLEFKIPESITIPICGAPSEKSPIAPTNPTRCLFAGALHWPPNAEGLRWFLRDVWPQIVQSAPQLNLTIIGKQPPDDIVDVANDNVEVLGYVEDLDPYLVETLIFVVPLWSGGGMRVKIVDAWTWGLPIVSTTIGAEGTTYKHDQNVLIADTPEEFAGAVLRIANDAQLAEELRTNGRQTALMNYDWQKAYQVWDAIYCA